MPCSHCLDLVATLFPAVKPRDRISFLFKHTCAPCCGCKKVEELLIHLEHKTNGSLPEVVRVSEEYEAAAIQLMEEYAQKGEIE